MKHTKKMLAAALAVCLTMAGCGSKGEVPVQQVGALLQMSAGTAAEKFDGVVVSENAVEIKREGEKKIKELYVAEGDAVKEGEKLFCYDSDELSLSLDKLKLELDRLGATIDEKKKQIASVESDLQYAAGSEATQLNIQLRQLQTELTQADYDKEAKQKEVDYTQKMLDDVDVKSPITGTVRKINETGDGPYMTIQQSDAYEVKGMLNELSLGAGIMEGVPVTIVSRMDPTKTWTGTVSRVDYNSAQNGSQNSENVHYMGSSFGSENPMTSSTSYPFYIKLDSTDGLLLGQHVYIQASGSGAVGAGQLEIPDSFLMNLHYNDKDGCNVAEVWAADSNGKLQLVEVVLAEYDPAMGAYPVIKGVTETDYIADPSNPDCKEGAKADHRSESDFAGNSQTDEPEMDQMPETIPADAEIPVDGVNSGVDASGDAVGQGD